MTHRITNILCIATVVIALAYDVLAIWLWGPHATITNSVRVYSHQWPLIPFLLGLLAGHWFWSTKTYYEKHD